MPDGPMGAFLATKDFAYTLPPELIAQHPLPCRADSRLLRLSKKDGHRVHGHFRDLPGWLQPGDCLVLNQTKVLPARLLGQRADSGGAVEVLLLRRRSGDLWETLVKPGRKCREGAVLSFGGGRLRARVERVLEDGNRLISFAYEGIWEEVLEALGEMPLPPYITRRLKDQGRYQTVYAKEPGSAAAPTAGLHFTPELLEQISAGGVHIAKICLHVGLGTFRPVKEENALLHRMHREEYSISPEAADTINAARAGGGRIICVGTTSCRALESRAGEDGRISPIERGETGIFIYPGYRFRIVDGLITNFHLPESTLLMLVSALAGRERVLDAYREAVEQRYRFFSFGDGMFII